MAHSFHVSQSHAHLKWNNRLAPVLRVPSGTEVTFDLKDASNDQIRPDNASTALAAFDFSQTDPAFGPVFVEGAEPGDILQVDILSLTTGDFGWTALFDGFGLLADEYPPEAHEQNLKIWDLRPSALVPSITGPSGPSRAVFKPGITVPVRPFLGIMGIAPAEDGELSVIPPYALSGGNIDTRYLNQGATVRFAVQVPGALFSCGDGHAAQGDGEVCGTAIETPMKARLRLSIIKKETSQSDASSSSSSSNGGKQWMELHCLHYITPPRGGGEVAEDDLKGTYAALGIHADPREAARMALRGLVDWLMKRKGLDRVEAYMLASVAASLRMTEAVDMPNYAVSCSIPLATFAD
ncbi:acetamidase/formamidase [Coniella lustricola]|uniref:Acetamidase/formamidase n=1 Tax=Coniella lustricola TaxID=2025994 RepID=A0A2T3AKU6_9PEZI|nr:acetamidase/formamidase [Coniella lustricola]